MHGYAIAQHIGRLSEEVLRVEQGSLYPALDRLQRQGWVKSEWRETPTKRRARYYTITASGRKQLGEELSRYDRVSEDRKSTRLNSRSRISYAVFCLKKTQYI